jgi:hypothetical protein
MQTAVADRSNNKKDKEDKQMTEKEGDSDVHSSRQGVPEHVVDHSDLLTRPVFSDLLREVSEHPDKLEKLRLIAGQHLEMTVDELQDELSKVYGRRLTLQETISVVQMLS